MVLAQGQDGIIQEIWGDDGGNAGGDGLLMDIVGHFGTGSRSPATARWAASSLAVDAISASAKEAGELSLLVVMTRLERSWP
jgi:hypothetical protein